MVNVQREIRNGLKDDYPYSVSIADLSVETTTDSERACKSSDVNLYGACLLTNCTDPSDPTCIIRECVHILSGLSAECKFCLVVQVGTADGITACAAEPAADYGRSFGLLLLSKKEILSSHAEGYLGNVSEVRGYYQASVSLYPVLSFIIIVRRGGAFVPCTVEPLYNYKGQVGMGHLSLVQWSLSTRDKLGMGHLSLVQWKPLYKGQVGDGSVVP